MQIRLGYELIYRCPQPTPMILNLNIHYTRTADLVRADNMFTDPWVPLVLYRDGFGNWCTRLVAPAGRIRITADAVINDRGLAEPVIPNAQQHTVETLPEETLVYLLGSRYCDTEHLSAVAWNLFGNTTPGWTRVQSICDFINRHITFGYQFARSTRTASEAFHERQGVCRDYAHLAITLCRCLNIPARYLSGGTQIYANPTTLSHFEDANSTTKWVTTIVASSIYLLASSGTAQTFTINCGVGGKFIFNGCAFIQGGTTGVWNLYGHQAFNALVPAIVELNGCSMNTVIIDTPPGFITERKDCTTGTTVLSDYPLRVTYRNSITLPSGLPSGAFTNVVPPSALSDGSGYLLVISVNNPGLDSLSVTAFVNSVGRNGPLDPSGNINTGTAANFNNNLTNQIFLRYGATALISGLWVSGIEMSLNETLSSGSTASVALVRIANPGLDY